MSDIKRKLTRQKKKFVWRSQTTMAPGGIGHETCPSFALVEWFGLTVSPRTRSDLETHRCSFTFFVRLERRRTKGDGTHSYNIHCRGLAGLLSFRAPRLTLICSNTG